MKTYETFVYWDAKNHYAFYNSDPSSCADLKELYLNRDFLNRIMKTIKNEYDFEKIIIGSFRK
jgi:hypothetical protein